MLAKRGWLRIGLAIAAAAVPATAVGQITPTPSTVPNQYPPALPLREGPPPPRLAIELVREIPLPGLPQDGSLRLTPDGVEIPLSQGVAVASPERDAGAVALRDQAAPVASDTGEYTVHPSGRLRFRAMPDGYLLAERYHSCGHRGWRKAWRLRLPASIPARPVLVGKRLCFTALDDQAYCVRADNGHRLWAVDLGERVSRPLAVWSGAVSAESTTAEGPKEYPLDVLLVVPDSGASVVALDPYNGQRLTAFSPAAGWFASGALVLPDQRVAVARKGYAEGEAALAVLRLHAPAPAPAPATDPVLYNPPSPSPDPSHGGGSLGAESGDDEPARSGQGRPDRVVPRDGPVSEGRR